MKSDASSTASEKIWMSYVLLWVYDPRPWTAGAAGPACTRRA